MKKNFTFLLLLSVVKLSAQNFKPVQINPFGISTGSLEYNDMQFADLTNDGSFDIIFNGFDEGPFIIVNKGMPGSPDFTNVPFHSFFYFNENEVGQGTFSDPSSTFIDGDGDGDLDHLFFYGSDDPTLPPEYILELNKPELATPAYAFYFEDEALTAPELGLPYQPTSTIETHAHGDLNGDGTLDMLANRYDEITGERSFVFYENTANMGVLAFNNTALLNPFALTTSMNGDESFGFPGLFDPDADGDLDLLLSIFSGDWAYYENTGTPTEPIFAQPVANPFGLTPLPTFGITHFIDVNGDGSDDLICGAGDKVYYFEFDESSAVNRLEKTAPAFSISPNPATYFINVATNGWKVEAYSVFDIYGSVVMKGNVEGDATHKIQVGNLAKGIYFIELFGKNDVSSCLNFIKQ